MGEELWLWRKHRGLSQGGAAARLGLAGLAHGGREYLAKGERGAGVLGTPRRGWTPLAAPSLPLLLKLARRRSGLGVSGTVLELRKFHRACGVVWEKGVGYRGVIGVGVRSKVSAVTLHKWEATGSLKLCAFWIEKGFFFPPELFTFAKRPRTR